jgi:DNA (cytosine-5)-methyltransferase 1
MRPTTFPSPSGSQQRMPSNVGKPIAVDLFSGAGGLSLGFARNGFDIAAWVEKNAYAADTLRLNHPQGTLPLDPVITGDVRTVPYSDIEQRVKQLGGTRIDVLIGGPPCKGFSRSNKRTRTKENPLNYLYRHYLAFARKLRPRIVVMENVGDIRHFEKGEVVEDIECELTGMGYSVQMRTLDASHFGVPQVRHRTIIVAHQKRMKFVYPSRNCDHPLTVWDAISDLPEVPNGNLVDELPYKALAANWFQRRARGELSRVTNNLVTMNGELVLRRYRHIPQGGNWRNIPDDLMQNYEDKERCHNWIYRRLPEDLPSVTITNFRKNMLIHPREDRGLSVREAARLQSFPDSYRFTGGILHQQQQVADAVPPLMADALALKVLEALQSV